VQIEARRIDGRERQLLHAGGDLSIAESKNSVCGLRTELTPRWRLRIAAARAMEKYAGPPTTCSHEPVPLEPLLSALVGLSMLVGQSVNARETKLFRETSL